MIVLKISDNGMTKRCTKLSFGGTFKVQGHLVMTVRRSKIKSLNNSNDENHIYAIG